MQSLAGYKITKTLYVSDKIGIYRGTNSLTHKSAILKVLKSDFPDKKDVAQLKYEYNILKNLKLPSVIQAYRLIKQNRQYALILEDIPDGISLTEFLIKKQLMLSEFLPLAIQIAEALVEIHQENIIHKDINPNNIIISTSTGKIKIIDFNIASKLSTEKHEIENMSHLEGTLAYLSPEQTGRMNRSIDHRSDIYSLGVTFYQMLTGKLPFEANDAMELVHCHIAKHPIAPNRINTHIPKILSDIVMKMMAKSAEERYQSARGLLMDLQLCLSSWQTLHTIADFKLEEKILYNKLQISERLYGREESLKILEEAFSRVCNGKVELVFVKGEPGIGKSSLINEIHKPILQQHGYFISGKYDQFKQDVPYLAIIQAFRKLIRQILTEPPSKIAKWQNKLSHTLEKNGNVLIEIIPELEKLIGKQAPVESLSSIDSRNRFELAFLDFISIFAQASHPLVIFIDDLQWADISSLNLLKLMLRRGALQNLFIISAFRDTKAEENPLLLDFIDYLKKEQPVSEITLLPLKLENIENLISDTFQQHENIVALSKLVLEKTGGNPFFVNAFLTMLYDSKYIFFDDKQGGWAWNIESIKELGLTDNVVDFIASKIRHLNEKTQMILKIAASIGDQFNLETLFAASKLSPGEILDQLWIGVQQSLIVPLSEGCELAISDHEYAINQSRYIVFRFSHDRIRQATYGLLKSHERKKLALKISRSLIKNTLPQDLDEHIFEIAGQYNRCLSLISDQDEIELVTKLNQQAGKKAKQATAYDLALTYFRRAKRLLGDDPWQKDYETAMAIYVSYAECLHLSGKFSKAAKEFDKILKYTKKSTDKARLIILQALSFSLQSKNEEVVKTWLRALETLGIHLDMNPSIFTILRNLIYVKRLLRNKSSEELLQLPVCNNEDINLTCEIMARMGFQPAIFSHSKLLILIALRGLQFTLRYGNTDSTAVFYLWYGIMHLMMKKYRLGFEYGDLAVHLSEKFENSRIQASVFSGFSILNGAWHLPYRKCLSYVNKSYQIGKQSGEIVSAQIASAVTPMMMLAKGEEIVEISKKVNRALTLGRFTKFNDGNQAMLTLERAISLLQGEKDWAYFEERIMEYLQDKIPHNTLIPLFSNSILILIICCIYQKWELAGKVIEKSLPIMNLKAFRNNYLIAEFFFYSSFVYLNDYEYASFFKRLKLKRRLKKNLAYLKRVSTYSPDNFGAKYYLILSATEAVIKGDLNASYRHYSNAVEIAEKNDMTHILAIANEFFARFFHVRKKNMYVQSFLQQALLAYNYWGARSKCLLLEKEYEEVLLVNKSKISNYKSDILSTKNTSSITKHTTEALDFGSIMKSVQIISGNVELEELLRTSIKMLIENAGAERGLLFVFHKKELVIEAECETASTNPIVLQHELFNSRDDFAKSIIYYVQRAQESIVLDNASRDTQFNEDAYIKATQARSICCMPIVHQGRFLGVLYLENNLTASAFTPNRVELLQILSSQVAISLENALLNAAYNQFVPHEFLDLLGRESIVDISLGDQIQRQMTVLFCDIRGFTTMSEKLSPNEVFQFINEYLGYMEPIIKSHGGFIDKYIGDAIMALFPGAPEDAIAAGLAMVSELHLFNQKRVADNKPPIRIGIGINNGLLTLGTIGTSHRLETSVLSDAVNQASRVEGLTKTFGSTILITQQVYDQLQQPDNWEGRYVGKIHIRGKETEVAIWEIYTSDVNDLREIKLAVQADYDRAIELYNERQFQEALILFQHCLSKLPNDLIIPKWIEQCHSLINNPIT